MSMISPNLQSALTRRLNAVLSKSAGLALAVMGEAGIGKSFHVSQALREISCQSASVHATSNEDQWAKTLPKAKKLPAWVLRNLEKLEAGDFLSTEALVNTFVANMALLVPFVLHLEDVHEAKPERLAFIEKLGQAAVRTKGVALIVTSRYAAPAGFSGLQLLPLEKPESQALLERELGALLPIESLEYIFARAQGNPLFTLEFLKYLTRHGSLWSDGTIWHWRAPPEGFVPVTVEALIEQMISSVANTSELRVVLEARAIVPSQIAEPFTMCLQLTNLSHEAFSKALEVLTQDSLLRELDFSHPLIREVILNSLTAERRAELSRKMLVLLEEAQIQLAARFVGNAGITPPEKYAVLQKAAIQAHQQGDTRLEAGWLVQSLEFAPLEERAELAIRTAKMIRKFDLREAIRVASIAVSINPKDAKAVFLLATLKATAGELLEAEELIAQLPIEARESEFGLKQHLVVRSNGDDQIGAFEVWQKLQATGYIFDSEVASQVIQTVYVHGDGQTAKQLADQALALELSATNRASILIDFYARYYFELGDYLKAEHQISLAVELLRSQDDPRILALAIGNRGIVRGSLNRELEAIEDFKEAANMFAEIGLTLKFAECLDCLGTSYSNLGQFAQAESALLEARSILRPSGIAYSLAKCESSLANLYSNWLPPHGASLTLKHARAALEYAQNMQNPLVSARYLKIVSLAEAGHGDPKKALAYAEQLLTIAEKLKNPRISKQAQHAYGIALGVSGKTEQAVNALKRVIEIEAESGMLELTDTIELEIDRITHNLESARLKIERYKQDNELMLLTLARRYFTALTSQNPDRMTNQPDPPEVQLLVLGTFSLEKHNQTINYRGRKRSEFLLYLLETRISGREEANSSELTQVLYLDLPEAEARASLKQLVYLIRQQLGNAVVQSTQNGYALGAVHSDLEDFLETDNAKLWRGKYLAGVGEGWIPSVREAVVHALQTKVEMLSTTDAKEAGRLGKILLEMETYDLDALELTLRALNATSESPKRLYLEMRQRFLEVGERLPETMLEFLKQRETEVALKFEHQQ
jgi:tetratricopeptide (TPR) repeat protein